MVVLAGMAVPITAAPLAFIPCQRLYASAPACTLLPTDQQAFLSRCNVSHQFQILGMGDKSERAQKIFALDYCAGAFVTEGEHCSSPPSFCVASRRASKPGGCCPLQTCVGLQARQIEGKKFARDGPGLAVALQLLA